MSQERQSGDLYRPVYKDGTHLAPSKNTEGAFRGSTLDDETNQIAGQAEWIKIDESSEIYDYQEYRQESELSPEAKELAQLIGEAIAAGTILVINEVVAPRVKYWWQEVAAPTMRRKLDDIKNKNWSKMIRKINTDKVCEMPVTSETVSALITQELDEIHEKYVHNMTSAEVQCELLDIFILSVMLTAKIRKLSNARIKDGDAPGKYLEGQEVVEKLSSPEYVSSVNRILENNPQLFRDKSSALSEIFGDRFISHSQYVPIDGNRIKEYLMAS